MSVTRRQAIKSSLLAGVPALASARLQTRPNILFLMADQFRADCLGADGNRVVHTPNLDRIAREGARFRCAYSSMPTCTPARSGLLTGLAPWNHGMLRMIHMAEQYPFEKPRAMREAGYYTIGIGKMHYHPQRNTHGYHQVLLDESGRVELPAFRSDYRAWFWSEAPDANPDATGIGWNDYAARPYVLPERLHPTTWTGDTAVRFLSNYRRPEPFFLKVSFARPHSPYDPPERFWKRYADADLPAARAGAWAAKYAPKSAEVSDLWHGDLGREQVRRSRQGYYGSVTFVDEQIGRVLEALDKRGWLDQTLIVFTADHGDMTGDHNLWRKSYPYQQSARIPMLVRWPTGLLPAERGQTRTETVELRDILPTFLDAAGQSPREGLDGRSMLPLLAGKSAVAGVPRSRARRLLFQGESLERADRRALEIHLPRLRRRRAALPTRAGSLRIERPRIQPRAHAGAPPLAGTHGGPPGAPRRDLCEERAIDDAARRAAGLAQLPRLQLSPGRARSPSGCKEKLAGRSRRGGSE